MSRRARWGSTVAAALVPATTTVWCSRAETIWPAQVACRLHPCFLSLASILALPARFSSAGVDQVGDGPPRWRRAPGHGPRVGRGLGERLAPDPALGLVDLAGQVQVEASQHRQGSRVLVRGADGAQGVGHGPGRVGDDGSVLGVGLGAARRQVGDASHGQPGQVAHGDAHVLSHSHRQGPDGGGLIDHHQQVRVIGQLLVERAQALLVVGQGPVEDLPALSAQGRGPVLALTDVDTDEDFDILDIHLSCRLSSHG